MADVALTDLRADDPRTLGPYRLTGRLGSGGMGVVYLGFGHDGEPVAVKTLSAGADEAARARMAREAAHMSAVASGRLPSLLASDTSSPVPWLALSYVPGPSLAEARLPLPEPALRALAEGLAEALVALGAAGIVHRDVKPGNVILRYDGPVLVDLGISRSGSVTALTQAGTTIGSPGWMPPEQLRGEAVGAATDVWGWGAVMAYAATGRPPFGEGPLEAIGWRVMAGRPDLQGMPEWLARPVRAALAAEPAHRPSASSLTTLTAVAVPPHRPATSEAAAPSVTPDPRTAVRLAWSAPPSAQWPPAIPWAPPPGVHYAPRTGAHLTGPVRSRQTSGRRIVAIIAAVVVTAFVAAAAAVWLSWDEGNISGRAGGSGTAVSREPTSGTGTAPRNRPSPLRSPAFDPFRPTTPAPVPTYDSGWPPDAGAYRGSGPAFPLTLEGYRLERNSVATVIVRPDGEWATMPLAAAAVDCDPTRYLMHWSTGEGTVGSGLVDPVRDVVMAVGPTAAQGWMAANRCRHPAFRQAAGNADGRQRVFVEYQIWTRRT